MYNQQPLGPDPAQEVDDIEFSIEVPVLVTVTASADADIDSVKREAIENLNDALNGVWGFVVDAYPDDCGYGFV